MKDEPKNPETQDEPDAPPSEGLDTSWGAQVIREAHPNLTEQEIQELLDES